MSSGISVRVGSNRSHRSVTRARAAIIAAGLLALGAQRAQATGQNGAWIDTTTGGFWSNSSNWQSGLVAGGNNVPNSQGNNETGNVAAANFNTSTLTGAMLVHLDTSEAISNLNFGDVGNTYGWTLDNNGSTGNVLTLVSNLYGGSLGGANSSPSPSATTVPDINVADQSANITAEFQVTGNGYNATAWELTGNGTLSLNNTTDTWGGGFTMTGGTSGSPLTLNVNIGSGTVVGSTSTSADYYGHFRLGVASQASTDNCFLNLSTGTVNCSQLFIGTSNGGTGVITVGTGAGLNIGNGTGNGDVGGLNCPDAGSTAGTETINVAGNVGLQSGANMSAGGYYQHALTINQTAGLFAFYSDGGTTPGGTGVWYNKGGSETYNLVGGTFSVPGLVFLGNSGGQGGGTDVINLNGGILQLTNSGNLVQNYNYSGSGAVASNFVGTSGALTLNVLSGGGTIDPYGNAVVLNGTTFTHAGSGTDGGIAINDSASTPGSVTISGANTYTGSTNITRGALILSAGTTISSSNAINIGSGGTLNVSALASPFTTLSTQPISGIGTITGPVNAPAGSITAGLAGVGGPLTITGALALSGASTAFNLVGTSSGVNGSIIANGGLSITAATTVDAIFSVLPLSSQTYTLFSYSGSALSTAAQADLSLSLAGSTSGYNATLFSLSFATPGQVNLVFTPASGASQNLIWASTSSHTWDVGISTTWTNSSSGSPSTARFNQGDNVTFDDTNGVTTSIVLNTTVQPSSVTDTASNNNFSISGTGKVSGFTNLTMSGSGTLTIGTSNDFTGTTFLNNGTIVAVNTAGSATGVTGVNIASGATLKIGDNVTTGGGLISGAIANNGTLILNRPDTYTLSTPITGSGTVTQAGTGTTVLSVAQQGYSGPTNINAGTIQYGVTNSLPFNTNLTLAGSGTLNINGLGQTFNNQVTSGTGTNINLGGGNLTLNTSSPDILQGQITGTAASSVYLTGTASATLSNAVTTGTVALANNATDNVTLTVASGANVNVTNLNVADGNTNGGTGTLAQTGGLISVGTFILANASTVTNSAVGIYTLAGGTLNVSTGFSTAQSQNSRALISIRGGTINMLGNSTLLLGQYYGEPTTIDQTAGSVVFANGNTGGIQINGEGTYTWNLSGGVLSVPRITWGGQAANNTYGVAKGVINFNGGTLQTTAANSAFFPANVVQGTGTFAFWTTTVTTGGANIDTDGNAVTFINNMAHDATMGSSADGGLNINDSAATAGALTLAASNSYTGNTTITRGTLALAATGSINSSPVIYVGTHGTFDVSGQSGVYTPAMNQVLSGIGTVAGALSPSQGVITGGTNGSAGTLTFAGPLTLNGGTALFDLASAGSGPNDLLVASGGLNVASASIIDAVFATAPTSAQSYLLFNYSGTALSSAAQALLSLSAAGSASGVTVHNLSLSFNGTTDQVFLKFTPGVGTSANLTWASTSSAAWDSSSVNWHNPAASGSGSNAVFFNGDSVTFDDTAGVKTAITLNIAAQPNSVTISSNTNNFSFTGAGGIAGTTGLNKTGTSNLTLATDNSYSGPTNLNGGVTTALNPTGYATGITSTTINSGATLQIGNGSTAGAGNATGAITNNGSLILDRPDTFTFPASVSGNAFAKIAAGTAILTGVSTYSGDTNIQAGMLQLGVNNALPTGTNINITNVAGSGFALGSFTQTIGDLNGGANSTLALGTGQLTVTLSNNDTFAGPITSSSGASALLLTNGGNFTTSSNVSAGTISVAPLDNDYVANLTIGSGNVTVTNLNVADGSGTGGTGQINQNGGTVNATNVNLANTSAIPGNASATYDLNGGTLNVSTGILMSNSTGASSALNISPGATLNLLGNSSITLGNYYGEPATILQSGGLVAFANGSTGGLQVNGGGIYSYTLAGGELSIPRISFGGQAATSQYGGATCTFEFDGSTLQVTSPGQFFPSAVSLNGAHWVTTIGSASATVDTAGNAVLFTNALITDPSTSSDGGLVKIGAGTLTLAGADSYNGGTNVSIGTLAVAVSTAYPAGTPLSVAHNAQFILLNHGANSTIVPIVSALTNNGSIDLNNNGLVVQSGTFTSISNQVKAAYNSGRWNGSSGTSGVISSSVAANDVTHLTAVGVAIGLATFESSARVSTDIELKQTYYGDANLDGMVDGSDYSIIDSNYLIEASTSAHISGWYNGDFNYDGIINGSDYTLIDNAYNSQGTAISAEVASPTALVAVNGAGSSVPEPASLGLLGIGASGLLRRRRHR